FKRRFHDRIHFAHRNDVAKVLKTCHALIANAARHNARIMVQVGADVERDAVEGHPFRHTNAYRGDLVLSERPALGSPDPHANPALTLFALDIERSKRVDHPVLEPLYETTNVAPALAQVEHDTGNALPRAVIGIWPAAP